MWSIGIARAASLEGLGQSDSQRLILDTKSLLNLNGFASADPFAIQVGKIWYLFFEMFMAGSPNAVIAVAESSDLVIWEVLAIALCEAHHLSFPFVFEHHGDYYMMPESKGARAVNLYRACDFPCRWRRVGTVLRGRYMDASIVNYRNRFWLFSGWGSYSLRIFHSLSPLGPWIPHLMPLARIYSKRSTRPGGKPVLIGDKLIRFAQDNTKFYGHQLRAMQVSCLNRIWYSEKPYVSEPILRPSGVGWNGLGMHHLDLHQLNDGQLLAFVDGRS